jgi:hypothetical protein
MTTRWTKEDLNKHLAKQKKPAVRKYRNEPKEVDGITFDSTKEAERYMVLKNLEQVGEISNLILQHVFPIIIKGQKICEYIADFTYLDKAGKQIVEDTKGMKTDVYRMKKKLMKAVNGIEILET